MADAFSVEAFYDSAQEFALSALDAHHTGRYRRVAIDAGTALEHLMKAALAKRSPALVADLESKSGFASVAGILGIERLSGPATVRTVSMTQARSRIEQLMRPKVDSKAIDDLVAMRNGTVHAAENAEVQEGILAAFAMYSDMLLNDLGKQRSDYWDGQLTVVDALLQNASDKLTQRYEVRRAAAEAFVQQRYATDGEPVMKVVIGLSRSFILADDQVFRECPVCGADGVAAGEHSVEYVPADWDKETGDVTNVAPEVWFAADSFYCNVCRLHLDSTDLIDKAFDPCWEIEDADWRDYEPYTDDDGDAAYERWRDEVHEL
jgi:hypothetical protein